MRRARTDERVSVAPVRATVVVVPYADDGAATRFHPDEAVSERSSTVTDVPRSALQAATLPTASRARTEKQDWEPAATVVVVERVVSRCHAVGVDHAEAVPASATVRRRSS